MKTTVIIPNYNGKHFMEPCMEALDRQTAGDFEVLIVDNGSTDGSVLWMEENLPGLVRIRPGEKLPPQDDGGAGAEAGLGAEAGFGTEAGPASGLGSGKYPVYLMEMGENTGFSGAVNAGIRASSAAYVLLLNNDTEAEPDFILELEKAMERSEKIFSVSSKMIQLHEKRLMDDAGDLYTVIGWAFQRGVAQRSSGFNKPRRIFSACAGAAIYRRSVFEQIGYFDEIHFAYLEDLDVGYRARIAGFENWYCPSAVVYHVGSGTSGSKYNPFKVRLAARNSVYLNYKNMPLLQLIVNAIPLAFGYLVKIRFFTKRGFGADYRGGLKEGFSTLKKCRKTPFRARNLGRYLRIEWELIVNTFIYAADLVKRRVIKL